MSQSTWNLSQHYAALLDIAAALAPSMRVLRIFSCVPSK